MHPQRFDDGQIWPKTTKINLLEVGNLSIYIITILHEDRPY